MTVKQKCYWHFTLQECFVCVCINPIYFWDNIHFLLKNSKAVAMLEKQKLFQACLKILLLDVWVGRCLLITSVGAKSKVCKPKYRHMLVSIVDRMFLCFSYFFHNTPLNYLQKSSVASFLKHSVLLVNKF